MERSARGFCLECEAEKIHKSFASDLEELENERVKVQGKLFTVEFEIERSKERLEKSIQNIECEKCQMLTGSIYPLYLEYAKIEKEKILTGINACQQCGKRNDWIEKRRDVYAIVFDPKNGRYFEKICSKCMAVHQGVRSLGGGKSNDWKMGNVQGDLGFYPKIK